MDAFGGRSLLIALYFEMTVLLIVGYEMTSRNKRCHSTGDRCCVNHECQQLNGTTGEYPKSDSNITGITQFLELSFNDTSKISIPCGTSIPRYGWYKAGNCSNFTTEFAWQQFLNFSGGLSLKVQGNYFCYVSNRDGIEPPNSSYNMTRVFVTIQGAETYLRTFRLNLTRKWNCNESRRRKMDCIEKCVNRKHCSNLQAQCVYAVKEVEYITSSVEEVRGLFYLRDFHNISQLEISHTTCGKQCPLAFPTLALNTTGTLQGVSFCESESINVDSVGNLTFPKTNIGMTANSTTNCSGSEKPMATRFCKGDFIGPSSWADPIVDNCAGLVGISSTTNLMINYHTKDSALVTKTNQKLTTESTTNVSTPVTSVNMTDANTGSIKINDDTPVTIENVNQQSRVLSEKTKNTEQIDAAYLMWSSQRLKSISEVGDSSLTVTRSVMEIVDNLLNVDEDVYRGRISGEAPSRILRALETQLTNLQKEGRNFTNVRSSLGVIALQLQPHAFRENITFGLFSSMATERTIENLNESEVGVMTGKDDSLTKYPATITLPASLLDTITNEKNYSVPVTFIIHRTSHLFTSGISQRRQKRERVESLVIAATLEGRKMSNLSSPVISRFHLSHVEGTMTKNSRKCVFWDFTLADGFGDWSSEGCELVSGSRDNSSLIVECHCNHLTNFAVLLDIQGDIDHNVLDILSIIGCVVSIFALIITLIVLLALKTLREQVPQQIIINLSFALLGLYICFLFGIDQSNLVTGCVIFGALIHYFCLASVAWMCIVAINMYLLFVRVFNADITGFMWKACLAAWGLPMIVVVVCVILKHQAYTSSYCFPQTGTLTFYLGVLLLVGLMLCFNLVIFMLIIRQVTCGRIGRPAGKDKRTEMFERAQSIFIISVLLGLTWVFGFLSIDGAQFIFNLLFLIFNSLQGFFVLIFFVLRPKNVRKILFQWCHRCEESYKGTYAVSKSQTEGDKDTKDSLDLDDRVVTSSSY